MSLMKANSIISINFWVCANFHLHLGILWALFIYYLHHVFFLFFLSSTASFSYSFSLFIFSLIFYSLSLTLSLSSIQNYYELSISQDECSYICHYTKGYSYHYYLPLMSSFYLYYYFFGWFTFIFQVFLFLLFLFYFYLFFFFLLSFQYFDWSRFVKMPSFVLLAYRCLLSSTYLSLLICNWTRIYVYIYFS